LAQSTHNVCLHDNLSFDFSKHTQHRSDGDPEGDRFGERLLELFFPLGEGDFGLGEMI
jgi:hypothetical protein